MLDPCADIIPCHRRPGEGGQVPRLAIAWALANPQVISVIPGASSPTQLDSNMAAAAPLSPETRAALDDATAALKDGMAQEHKHRNPPIFLFSKYAFSVSFGMARLDKRTHMDGSDSTYPFTYGVLCFRFSLLCGIKQKIPSLTVFCVGKSLLNIGGFVKLRCSHGDAPRHLSIRREPAGALSTKATLSMTVQHRFHPTVHHLQCVCLSGGRDRPTINRSQISWLTHRNSVLSLAGSQ